MKTVISLLLIIVFCGCAHTQTYAPHAQPSMPSEVNNQMTTHLVSVTAPIRITTNPTQFCNLNVTLEAIINPKKETEFSPSDVRDILYRSQTRIKAAVFEVMFNNLDPNINQIKGLRIKIKNAGQAAFDMKYQKWINADDYEVEIVVTSMSLSGL